MRVNHRLQVKGGWDHTFFPSNWANRLLINMCSLIIIGTVQQWIHSFPSNRSKMAMLGDTCSALWLLQYCCASRVFPVLHAFKHPYETTGADHSGDLESGTTNAHLRFNSTSPCLPTEDVVEILWRCLDATGNWKPASWNEILKNQRFTWFWYWITLPPLWEPLK